MHNKVNRVWLYSFLIAIFFLQITVVGFIKISTVTPDLGALFVIFVAIFFGWEMGLETGFVFGILKDTYSLDLFGANAASLALTGFVAGLLSPKLFRESRITQGGMVFVLTLFSFLVHYLIESAISAVPYISLSEYLFSSFIPVSLYTAVIAVISFPFLMNKFNLKENVEYL